MKIEEDCIYAPPGTEIKVEFENRNVVGILKIGNQVFNVYLGEMDAIVITDRMKPELEKLSRKFVLIEV